jgi:hypothetical protein
VPCGTWAASPLLPAYRSRGKRFALLAPVPHAQDMFIGLYYLARAAALRVPAVAARLLLAGGLRG